MITREHVLAVADHLEKVPYETHRWWDLCFAADNVP